MLLYENMQLDKIRDKDSTAAFGGAEIGGPSLAVGGVTPDGQDATNELSFMAVDALVHTRLHAPWITSRHHINEPEEWWVKCTKAAKIGLGSPSFFNDEVIIPGMLNRGIPIEDHAIISRLVVLSLMWPGVNTAGMIWLSLI